MKETKNVPQLRFSGFDDDWEEQKLGEISSKVSKKNTDNSITETFTNSAEFGIISQREFFDHDISNEENIDGYFIVENDDFVYNPRISTIAPVGPINRNKLGRSGVMSPLYYVFRTHDIDKSFLEKYFKSECWYDFMFLNGNSGARSDRFSITDSVFTQMPIRIPRNKLEQQKIGAFLSHVDSLIQAKTKKLESLKTVKKSLLQKCFPKDGEKTPQMRFERFSGDWKRMKFNDITSVFTDGDWIESSDQSTSGVRLIQTGNVGIGLYNDKPDNKKWISLETFKRLNCEEIFEGDILISRLPEPAGRACLVPNLNTRMITAVDCSIVRLKSDYDNLYLIQYLSSDKYFDLVRDFLAGGTRQRISRENLKGFNIPIPPTLAEQQKIGQFFSKYDSLISLQQKEIDKLVTIKKSLLQKMFV